MSVCLVWPDLLWCVKLYLRVPWRRKEEWRCSSILFLTLAVERRIVALRLGHLIQGKDPPPPTGSGWIWGWVGPIACLHAFEKRKVSCVCWESNHVTSVVQPCHCPCTYVRFFLQLGTKVQCCTYNLCTQYAVITVRTPAWTLLVATKDCNLLTRTYLTLTFLWADHVRPVKYLPPWRQNVDF
jgi:hypothetical protein